MLNAKFGHDWVVAHHYNNKGKLPERVGDEKPKKSRKKKKGKR